MYVCMYVSIHLSVYLAIYINVYTYIYNGIFYTEKRGTWKTSRGAEVAPDGEDRVVGEAWTYTRNIPPSFPPAPSSLSSCGHSRSQINF